MQPGRCSSRSRQASSAPGDVVVFHSSTCAKQWSLEVVIDGLRPDGGRYGQHHFCVVRPTVRTRSGKLLMLLPTSTWMVYNDWGGANH